jgi:DNA-binding NtrC family response regulator
MSTLPMADDNKDLGHGTEAGEMIGRCPAMRKVYEEIAMIASVNATVLLLGESGTGKDLAAHALHAQSGRKTRPFLALNCANIDEHLLESDLFGHEKGSFTGAERQHIGKFEQAHGGTLFLDEIGDMARGAQAKVLRVLQEQRFERLGGSKTITTDVRLIAATNANLRELVDRGQFRVELFYRLNECPIRLPPLRERPGDVILLAEHFLRLFNEEMGKAVALDPQTLHLLETFPWPGNVRELRAAIKYGLIHTKGDLLKIEALPEEVRACQKQAAAPVPPAQPGGLQLQDLISGLLLSGEGGVYGKVITAVEEIVMVTVLRHVGGKLGKAAQVLDISRPTLGRKLRALGLTAASFRKKSSN